MDETLDRWYPGGLRFEAFAFICMASVQEGLPWRTQFNSPCTDADNPLTVVFLGPLFSGVAPCDASARVQQMPTAFTPEQMSFTLGQVALNLCLAFALAFLASSLYRRLHGGPSYSFSFFVTLQVTPVVVAMIMMAIGSNVALSLGLVGALSIIRFRTVIKDTRDMSFLFLTIGIGLCCGSGAYGLAIAGTVFVCGILLAIHLADKTRLGPGEYILVFRGLGHDPVETDNTLQDLVSWRKLHGAADLGDRDGLEFTYRVRLAKAISPEALLARLRTIPGLSQSSLISPESQVAI